MSGLHPRLSINPASFPPEITMEDYVAALGRIGATRAGARRSMVLDTGRADDLERIERSGIDIVYLIHRELYRLHEPESWEQGNLDARATIDAAAQLGAAIYVTTGPGPAAGLTWEESADAFVRAAGPATDYAKERGVHLLVETASPQFADLHFLHTLRDTLDVARDAGLGLCLDVHPCWHERALAETIRSAGPAIGLVQLSDYVPGSRTMDRGIPGDGVAPLEEIIGWILETGYTGVFDLELWGDSGMDDEAALMRAADHVGELLERFGV